MLLKSKHMNGKEVLSWLTQESGKIKETEGVSVTRILSMCNSPGELCTRHGKWSDTLTHGGGR